MINFPHDWLENVALQAFNTLALPARAHFFTQPRNLASLQHSLTHARSLELPIFVLGGGSNVVMCGDWPGLVINYLADAIEVISEDSQSVLIRVDAGFNWHDLVLYCLEKHWHGLENLALIPGSVGAAPIQNIGAYGTEIADVLNAVEVCVIDDGRVEILTAQDCQLGYRDSVFKHDLMGKVVITALQLRLEKHFIPNLAYPVLANALTAAPTAEQVVAAVIAIRNSKLPDPTQLPNAGSFFKNPVVSDQVCQALVDRYPAMPIYPQPDGHCKLAAAWLIEQAGWKGRGLGPVAMHDKQALVLVNPGRGVGRDVLALAQAVQLAVFEKFAVDLEIEPQRVME